MNFKGPEYKGDLDSYIKEKMQVGYIQIVLYGILIVICILLINIS